MQHIYYLKTVLIYDAAAYLLALGSNDNILCRTYKADAQKCKRVKRSVQGK